MRGGWKATQSYTPIGVDHSTGVVTVDSLLSQRLITRAQHKAAGTCYDARVTSTRELWVNTESGRRQLIDRAGKVVMDYKR
jgi:hypothetical protein